jgi:hypothetical protein
MPHFNNDNQRYLTDSKRFLRIAFRDVKNTITPDEAIQSTLFFALGIEKLLKYLLSNINPTFVLKIPDFKHSAPSLYKELIVNRGNSEIENKPNSDVITFGTSLARAKTFSTVAQKHGQLLGTVSHWRNVIAHLPSDSLDETKVNMMLRRDAALLVQDFCLELDLSLEDFLGLAPNAKWRSKVIPQASEDSKSLTATPAATDSQEPPEHGRPMRLGWAKLLKRVFNLDLTQCPHCGGELRIVAAILQRQAIEKILNHLGLDPQPPPRAPARGQMAF